jgi:hypothetical protein
MKKNLEKKLHCLHKINMCVVPSTAEARQGKIPQFGFISIQQAKTRPRETDREKRRQIYPMLAHVNSATENKMIQRENAVKLLSPV